jgi:Gpi18-like mannosyltransferase
MRGAVALRIAACVAALYLLTIPLEGPDLPVYLYPWIEHIRQVGFAEPFGNYSPAGLYLLAAFAPLPISALLAIKLVALVSIVALAWSVSRLARALGCTDTATAALFALALPTVILNAALGQVDGLWSACCLMAVAMAIERRTFAMVAWAAVAFTFKAQAAFLAPLILAIVIPERKWLALALPPIVYLASIAPAWAAGWPLSDLMTIYVRQGSAWFIGNAPNLWAIPAALGHSAAFPLGYALAATAAVAVTATCSRRELDSEAVMIAALLSAILLPFLLPKMHERYFFLADVLALVMAYRWPDRIWLCAFVQVGSLLSLVAYLWPAPWLNAAASVPMAAALLMTLRLAADYNRVIDALPGDDGCRRRVRP